MKITMSNVFINISEYDRHSIMKVVRFYDMLCIHNYTCMWFLFGLTVRGTVLMESRSLVVSKQTPPLCKISKQDKS